GNTPCSFVISSNYLNFVVSIMKKEADTILKTFQLVIFLLVVIFPCVYGQELIAEVDKVKSKAEYESEIRQRVDSLRKVTPKGHVRHDSLLSVLYEDYKNQYLGLGGSGNWEEALPVALACATTFIGYLQPKEEADLIYNIGYIDDKSGLYWQGIDYFHRSIVRYEAIQDAGGQDVRNDIALAYNNIG